MNGNILNSASKPFVRIIAVKLLKITADLHCQVNNDAFLQLNCHKSNMMATSHCQSEDSMHFPST